MQGSIAIRNEPKAMMEAPPIEFLFMCEEDDTPERVTNDFTLYFQKAFIYPASAVGTGATLGVLTPNINPILVGKSSLDGTGSLTSLVAKGSIAIATKANHGFRAGMSVLLTGSVPSEYDKLRPVFNVTQHTFQYQLDADPGGPATTLPTVARMRFLPDLLTPTDLPIVYELPLGLKMKLSDIIARGKANDGLLIQAW